MSEPALSSTLLELSPGRCNNNEQPIRPKIMRSQSYGMLDSLFSCANFLLFFFMYEFFFSWCAYFFEQFFCRLLLSPRQVFFLSAVLSFLLLAASVSRFLAPKSTTNTMERSEYAHNVIIETQARVRCSMVNEGDKRMWQIYSFRCGGKTYIAKHVCCVCVCAVADMQRPCRLPAKSEVVAQCGGMRDTRETNELRTVMWRWQHKYTREHYSHVNRGIVTTKTIWYYNEMDLSGKIGMQII